MLRDSMSRAFDLVVVGSSAGGVNALTAILPALPGSFEAPMAVVQHRARGRD